MSYFIGFCYDMKSGGQRKLLEWLTLNRQGKKQV